VKASELRRLKGQQVQVERLGRDYVYPQKIVTVLDVKGKNVLVDELGMTDWLWIPDYRFTMVLDTEVA
jgi:hypothetical protein